MLCSFYALFFLCFVFLFRLCARAGAVGAVPVAAAGLSFLNCPHSKKHRYDEQKEHKNRAYVQLIHHINSDPMPYTSPAISHAMTH